MDLGVEGVLLGNEIVNIYVEGSKIAYVGEMKHKAKKTLNAKDKAAVPSLVNGHTHAAMTLFRGYGDDMKLQEWLQEKIWPIEAKLTPEDVYWGTKLASLEMIKCGITLFNDMYWHNKEAVAAVEEMGMRAVISEVFIDFPGMKKPDHQKKAIDAHARFKKYSSKITFALGPHALYTSEPETLRFIASYAKENNLLVHFHLSETKQEIDDCVKKYGKKPVHYLDELGFLHENLLAAHCVWLDDDELDILEQRKVKMIHNPIANFKLAGGGMFRYLAIKNRNIPFCLGTDGCGSNNNLDIFEEMKFSALIHKWKENDPTIFKSEQAWNHAVSHEMFDVDAGKIEKGKLADFILIDLQHPQMVPCHNLLSNLVYAGNGSIVDTVICDGKVLMENRYVEQEENIIRQSKKIAENLFNR